MTQTSSADPATHRFVQIASKAEVWTFFGVILALNTILVVGVTQDWLPGALFSRGRFYLMFVVLVAVVFVYRGWRATLGTLQPLTVWRVSPTWFLLAVLVPIVASVLFLLLWAAITWSSPDILGSGLHLLSRPNLLLTIFISSLVGEIVWVGFAIRMLRHHYPVALVCAIVGTAWGLWWLPMVYFEMGVIPNLTFVGLWMNMIGIAFFCAFFYLRTGSGLVILVMQFVYNCAALAFAVIDSGAAAYNTFSALYMIAGYLAVRFGLPKDGSVLPRSRT